MSIENKITVVPVLAEGEKYATRMAIIFNGKELPPAYKVTINNSSEGETIVTVVWGMKSVELKSFITEEELKNLT